MFGQLSAGFWDDTAGFRKFDGAFETIGFRRVFSGLRRRYREFQASFRGFLKVAGALQGICGDMPESVGEFPACFWGVRGSFRSIFEVPREFPGF